MLNFSIKRYSKDLLKIASPIIMGNLGFIMIGVGDVLVAGRHSTETFSAISIATAILNCIFTFGIGLIASISPLLSNYRGEKKSIKKYFYPSIKFAMVWAVITSVIIFLCIPLIPKMGFETNLVKPVQSYMFICALSTFGVYLHAALKEFLQAFEIVFFPNLLTIFCVFLNIILNVIFVFGFGVIPSLGVIGLAIASLIVRYFMGFVLLIYCYKNMKFRNYSDFNYYKSMIKMGLPISLSILIEFVAFNSIAIIMGRIAGIYAAAQNLLCTFTTITFMIPFAISNAMAVKVGYSNGQKNYEDLKRYAYIGTGFSVCFMGICALCYLFFPKYIVDIFTADKNLYSIVLPIMLVLAIFQTFDGLQISLSGICKGLKQTNIIMFSSFIAYWIVSFPLGYYLAFYKGLNLLGFWIGLLSASIVLCVVMLIRLKLYIHNTLK